MTHLNYAILLHNHGERQAAAKQFSKFESKLQKHKPSHPDPEVGSSHLHHHLAAAVVSGSLHATGAVTQCQAGPCPPSGRGVGRRRPCPGGGGRWAPETIHLDQLPFPGGRQEEEEEAEESAELWRGGGSRQRWQQQQRVRGTSGCSLVHERDCFQL